MATFNFETITAAQVGAFVPGSDVLFFASGDVDDTMVRVGFGSDSRITISAEGRSLQFGPGMAGQVITSFAAPGQSVVIGTSASDTLFGRGAVFAGPGNDQMSGFQLGNGGAGADTLSTANGVYAFDPGESLPTQSGMDVVLTFSKNNQISFNGLSGVGAGFVRGEAANFDDALTFANQQIKTGKVDVVAVTVGSDVIVFADDANDNGAADDAVILKGADPLDVFPNAFVGTGETTPGESATLSPPIVPSPPPPPPPVSLPPPPPPPPPAAPGTTFHFEDITAPLAATYKSASDSLLFSTPGTTGANTIATIAVVPTNTQAVTITLTSVPLGRAVIFGDGLKGETVTFPDNSVLLIGTSGNDALTGGPMGDGLYGGFGDDTLNGGAGDDVLDGGVSAFGDVLTGGSGSDLFVVRPPPGATQPLEGFTSHITDWEAGDRLAMSSRPTTSYVEFTAAGFSDGLGQANSQLFTSGGQYFAVAVGHDVVVFADTDGDRKVDDTVILTGRTLADIDASNFVPFPGQGVTPISPPPPLPPSPPEPSSQLTPIRFVGDGPSVFVTGSADALDINAVAQLPLVDASPDRIAFQGPTLAFEMHGNFIYSGDNLVGGTIQTQSLMQSGPGGFSVAITGLSIPVTTYLNWATVGDTASLTNALYGGNNVFSGSPGPDVMRGLGGNDAMDGRGGGDTIFGGQGDDAIQAGSFAGDVSSSYLRGEEGDDVIIGGNGFDDINGNQGNDTISGGQGDDWVVGGKDNDLQFGGQGNDIVWGNLGNDTLEGGDGADQIRGGQGDDLLFGDAGNDYISGDRGADSEVGGAGADIFHSFSGAGIDKVFDFNFLEGDKVMLDPGTTFTVSQVGADTVIDMGNGDQVILVGVLADTLPPGTIFLG